MRTRCCACRLSPRERDLGSERVGPARPARRATRTARPLERRSAGAPAGRRSRSRRGRGRRRRPRRRTRARGRLAAATKSSPTLLLTSMKRFPFTLRRSCIGCAYGVSLWTAWIVGSMWPFARRRSVQPSWSASRNRSAEREHRVRDDGDAVLVRLVDHDRRLAGSCSNSDTGSPLKLPIAIASRASPHTRRAVDAHAGARAAVGAVRDRRSRARCP